jgi:hypothetical protein
VLPDHASQLGPYAMLTPTLLSRLLDRHAAGWTPRQIADAFGLGLRSVYRYLELERPRRVVVDRWAAYFAARRGGPPVQLSEWIGTSGHD